MTARDYLSSPGHRELYEILGLPDPLANPDDCIKGTYQQDPRYILADGEEPVVRWRLEGLPPTDMSEAEKQLIEHISNLLGMRNGSRPAFGTFAGMAALGAARMANIHRLEHILKAIQSGQAVTEWLGMVGSARVLDKEERKKVNWYAPDSLTEFDLCRAAWAHLSTEYTDFSTCNLLDLPSPRARNMDAMRRVMDTLRDEHLLHDEATVAFSTNRIYEAFTAAEAAIVALEYPDTEIVVVSCAADQKTRDSRNHNTYKTEILRTDRAYMEAIKLGLNPELPLTA